MTKKDYFARVFCYFFIGLYPLLSQAQAQHTGHEDLYVSFDKPFYVAGEDMWFSAFFTQPRNRQSDIVHIEFAGPGGDFVLRQKLPVFNGYCYGDISLPPNLPEGYYHFRAFTMWNLNFQPQAIFERQIPVYSTTSEGQGISLSSQGEDSYRAQPSANLSITMERKRVGLRENVKMHVRSPLAQGLGKGAYISVSVMALPYANIGKKGLGETLATVRGGEPPVLNEGNIIEPPETQLTQRLFLRHPGTNEPVNSSFITGYIQESKQKFYSPAVDGVIRINLKPFQERSILQVFDANPFVLPYTPLVSVIPPRLNPGPADPLDEELPQSPAISAYVEEYRKQFQLNKVFGSVSKMRAPKNPYRAAFPAPDLGYVVDDYILFDSMEEFLEEVVPLVKIKNLEGISSAERKLRESFQKVKKKRKKKPILPEEVLNETLRTAEEDALYFKVYISSREGIEKPRYYEAERPPVLLVNNYFTYDAEAVLAMDWSNIERIDVFNLRENLFKQFGHIGLFGVVAFYTRDGETPPAIRNSSNNRGIRGYYPSRKYVGPRIGGESRIPNFNPLLYWSPDVFIGNEGETDIYFSTNDRVGTFLIKVEGITFDGQAIYAEEIMEVALKP